MRSKFMVEFTHSEACCYGATSESDWRSRVTSHWVRWIPFARFGLGWVRQLEMAAQTRVGVAGCSTVLEFDLGCDVKLQPRSWVPQLRAILQQQSASAVGRKFPSCANDHSLWHPNHCSHEWQLFISKIRELVTHAVQIATSCRCVPDAWQSWLPKFAARSESDSSDRAYPFALHRRWFACCESLPKVLRSAQSQHRAQLWQVSDCTTLWKCHCLDRAPSSHTSTTVDQGSCVSGGRFHSSDFECWEDGRFSHTAIRRLEVWNIVEVGDVIDEGSKSYLGKPLCKTHSNSAPIFWTGWDGHLGWGPRACHLGFWWRIASHSNRWIWTAVAVATKTYLSFELSCSTLKL